jgi:hypothetical protein
MPDEELEQHGQQAEDDDEQVIRSNKLLAAIRARMAKRRSGSEKDQPKELDIAERD